MNGYVAPNLYMSEAKSHYDKLLALEIKLCRKIDSTADARSVAALASRWLEVHDRLVNIDKQKSGDNKSHAPAQENALSVIKSKHESQTQLAKAG